MISTKTLSELPVGLYLAVKHRNMLNMPFSYTMDVPANSALIIVDAQNDFCENGALGVKGSDYIIQTINSLRHSLTFSKIFLTCDWHPLNHVSFVSANTNDAPESVAQQQEQSLADAQYHQWPVHCVAHSTGAAFHKLLDRSPSDIIVPKGKDRDTECYSGFGSATEDTGLLQCLRQFGIESVFIVGFCTDYCCGATAKSAIDNGFTVYLIADGCGAVSKDTEKQMLIELKQYGVHILNSTDILKGRTEKNLVTAAEVLGFGNCA